MKRALLAAALGSAVACASGESRLMLAGDDCMSCHSGTAGKALAAPTWTVAGTVYGEPDTAPNAGLEGVLVHVTDSQSVKLTLRSNAAGNFYTAEPLAFPLQVCVERAGLTRCMENAVIGSCNECHTIPSQNQAPGRVTAP